MTADPAESHSRPLGSEEKTRGIIQEKNRVDLNKAPFNMARLLTRSQCPVLGHEYVALHLLGATAEEVRIHGDDR